MFKPVASQTSPVTDSQLLIKNQVLEFLNAHQKSQLVAQLYQETKDSNPLSLKEVIDNLPQKRIEEIFIVYLQKPVVKVWRWSLLFLGLMLGMCFFTGLESIGF